ncbi:MAG: hypothetical protein QOK44_5392 [Betaproteobacteria bacterium]|jgi:hypothetical protein|nr:hypothetical protein [Betaproteobacteria bacterium]
MYSNWNICVIALLLVSGCAMPARQAATHGSRHSHQFRQPPDKAAACFARNAEEHSSALVSEVRTGQDTAHVIIRVKNGVTYATADFERMGNGSRASVTLNVTTSSRQSDLLDALTEGC